MENNELKTLFNKFNENCYNKDEELLNVIIDIYKNLNLNKEKIQSKLNLKEECILLKSIYLIEFHNIKVLQKPVNNLLYFILKEDTLSENIKNDYINQAEILIKNLKMK